MPSQTRAQHVFVPTDGCRDGRRQVLFRFLRHHPGFKSSLAEMIHTFVSGIYKSNPASGTELDAENIQSAWPVFTSSDCSSFAPKDI